MCGISGIISRQPVEPDDIHRMTMALRHRGPDAQQIKLCNGGKVALGHTRLSVLDLSVAAHQPMASADGRYTIVFNGEIYNFKSIQQELKLLRPGLQFQTQGDTEVVLYGYQQWGKELARKLEGMFAIAIYDADRDELVLMRDRLGKKPIYYGEREGVFYFASEIKSILAHPRWQSGRTVRPLAITQFLHLGYVPGPATIYADIHKFPAATVAVRRADGNLTTELYWSAERTFNTAYRQLSDEGAISLLRQSLDDAVRKRLISDVPLGAFLSGGTDSSLVAALANRHLGGTLRTFNIGFEENEFDESSFARKAAAQLRTSHTAFVLKEAQAADMLEECMDHFDEPFADTSAIPTMLISRIAREQVTVALTGDGGDELFLGYGMYDWANRLNSPVTRMLSRPLQMALQGIGNDRTRRVAHLFDPVAAAALRAHIFSQEQYFFSGQELHHMQQPGGSPLDFRYEDPSLALRPDEKQALFDLHYYLPDDLLVKVDRASMKFALECRSPLLDSQVVALALSLPHRMKRRQGERKWILKKLLCEHLSHDLVYRTKWGFSVPLAKWLRKDMAYLLDDYLNPAVVQAAGLFDPHAVTALLNRFRQGENYLYNRLWVLVMLHRWMKKNG